MKPISPHLIRSGVAGGVTSNFIFTCLLTDTEIRNKCQDKTARQAGARRLHCSYSEFLRVPRLGVFQSFGEQRSGVAWQWGAGQWFLVLCSAKSLCREPILPVAPPRYILYATPAFIAGSTRIHEGSIT